MALPKESGYTGNFERPSEDINPFQKQNSDKYSRSWLQHIYSAHVKGSTGINQKLISRIDYLRSFAHGKQDPNIYKQYFDAEENSGTNGQAYATDTTSENDISAQNKARVHYMDVDFNDIFSPAPKYINNIIGRFIKINIGSTVKAIDEKSGTEKEDAMWGTWARSYIKVKMDEIDKVRGIEPVDTGEALPESLEELDMYNKMGKFKTRYERAMEESLSFTAELSEQPEIQKKVVTDILTANIGATETVIDRYDGFVKYEYVDPRDLIIEYSSKDMFDKSTYYGYIKNFRLADLREKLPKLTEEELRALASNYTGQYGNPNEVVEAFDEITASFKYDNFTIPVLKGAWITTDKHMHTTRTLKNGETITSRTEGDDVGKPRIRNGKGRKTYPLYIKTVYEGHLVLGTDYVFDYGRMTDIPFDFSKKTVRLPINVYKIKGKSIIESMIPMLNQVQMTYLKLQNAIAKAPPPGLKIDIGKNKSITMGGKDYGPLELITLRTHTGNMIYDSTMEDGQIAPGFGASDPGKAIEELSGGLGTAINEAILSWEMAFNAISDLTGIDRASSVTSQPARTSASETRIAAAGTSDTLNPILDAWKHIVKRGSENAALRIQSRCSVKNSPYVAIIGRAGVQAIAAAAGKPPIKWGIIIRAQATDEEKADALAGAIEAMKGGILSYSQYLFVKDTLDSGGGLNQVQQYIAYQEAKAEKRSVENARVNQEIDAVNQQKTADIKIKGEVDKIDAKTQGKIKEITHQTNENIRKMKIEASLKVGQFAEKEKAI